MEAAVVGSERCRVAVLADIHGNLVALRAVLADLDAENVDGIVVAGDMVGFGPSPDEVVDLLVERNAQMIRGNHEKDYVAVYGTPQMPDEWRTAARTRSLLWTMERLGPGRRAMLASLPDRRLLDSSTVVVHGSPRSVRDSIFEWTSEPELTAMLEGEESRLVLVGHTHRALTREIPGRRIVNVGSVGFPLDGDTRATYAIATPSDDGQTGSLNVSIRRVAYDIDAAVAAFDGGLGQADPCFLEVLARQLRTGRSLIGAWVRASDGLAVEELPDALARFLREQA